MDFLIKLSYIIYISIKYKNNFIENTYLVFLVFSYYIIHFSYD